MRKSHGRKEPMSNWGFRVMVWMYNVADVFTSPGKRINDFNIKQGMTLVDYGCGPGRYIRDFSRAVGNNGKVYAADIHGLALQYVKNRIKKYKLENVETVLVKGHSSTIPDKSVDMICCLDMFHRIEEPGPFLKELHRIVKKKGILIIEDGHQPRARTKQKVMVSTLWQIDEEHDEFLTCSPR